jgi:hypothetical protein
MVDFIGTNSDFGVADFDNQQRHGVGAQIFGNQQRHSVVTYPQSAERDKSEQFVV